MSKRWHLSTILAVAGLLLSACSGCNESVLRGTPDRTVQLDVGNGEQLPPGRDGTTGGDGPRPLAGKKQVLDYLAGLPKLPSQRVLSGQCVASAARAAERYNNYVVKLQAQTGHWVGMLGLDYGLDPLDAGLMTAANGLLKKYWQAGGLVTICAHLMNPFTGGDSWDTTSIDLTKLYTPGSSVYDEWMSQLDLMAAALAELRDAGVVVLWRPFHEMNGDWFWWSRKADGWAPQAEFKALWKQMYDYFTKTKGLNNLIWVYAPNVQTDPTGTKATAYYYPGGEMVDVVGIDVYLDDLSKVDANGSMTSLLALGKPFGLTEFGPKAVLDGSFDNMTLIKGIKTYAPQAAFWQQWASWTDAAVAIVDCKNAAALMSDPWVASRDHIKLGAP